MGLTFALLAALCTAFAAMLQAVGAHRAHRYRGVDPRLLAGLVRSRPYLAGLGLDATSSLLTLAALHSTPLFVVQAIDSGSLAIIAALSKVRYKRRLRVGEWSAIAAVCGGVTLVVVAERPGRSLALPLLAQVAVLAAPMAIAVFAYAVGHRLSSAVLPGLLAGLVFGDAAVAGRAVARLGQPLPELALTPTVYALVVSGVLGTLLYATALQHGSVTAASGMSTVGQTLGPAVTGWLVLGDHFRPGLLPVAVVGFVLTIGGAVLLSQHAHPHLSHHQPHPPPKPH